MNRWIRSLLPLPALVAGACKPSETPGREDTAGTAPMQTIPSLPVQVSFNDHVQPVLSEYCYHCHGPDAGTREPKDAPLRLDRPEDAFALRDDGKPVIVKGDPGASKILARMRSADPDLVMPPPESHKTMKAEDIALLKRWIEQGAVYEKHWSFEAIADPDPPSAGDGWATNEIDRFIAEALDEAGLAPNPPEDPRRFHRRLALDLTGLPPDPAATDAFVEAFAEHADAAVDAEARRLLEGIASAEHFARQWLDAARYGDTHGIHIDNYRAIWPYRDWVVRAFHANLPWDQFTLEQIAGDLLPDPTLDQQVATGFLRCLPTTGEGGAIDEEYEMIYASDRVDTMAAAWLGLTTSCAACHDHKFDPLSTREFYSLTAFFRNSTMTAMDGNDAEHPPSVFVPAPGDEGEWESLQQEIAAVRAKAEARKAASWPEFEAWLATVQVPRALDRDAALELHLPLREDGGPIRGFASGKPREWPADLPRVESVLGKAPLVSGGTAVLGDLAGFSRNEQVSYGGFIRFEGKPSGSVVARIDPANGNRGWDLYLHGGHAAGNVIDTWDGKANKIIAYTPLKPGVWNHVMITFDGTKPSKEASAIYVNGERARARLLPDSVGESIEATVPLRIGSRDGGTEAPDEPTLLQDFRFYRRLLDPAEILELSEWQALKHVLSLPVSQRTREQLELAQAHYLRKADPPSLAIAAELAALRERERPFREGGSATLIMEERKDSEPHAHVLERGVYSQRGERVGADTPAVLPPMPPDAPKNRLGLAKWLNDPANPLPARVTMNRTWSFFFGTGIVETNGDFGIMGARPSHPKLLDWLASRFIASGWNHREMIRLIVTSATYRQSATIPPEKLEADPGNRLLSRGPRVRLDAEPIRDLALAASGLLSRKVGGHPVKPYQPEGIWEAVAMPQSDTKSYQAETGESLYRRSLYTMWKRTAPPPSMEILNAPSRETFCVRRDRTNTPLQALVMLNDPQFVEASRTLAGRALARAADFDGRIDFITLRLVNRTLDPDERRIVGESLERILTGYRAQPEEAARLLAVGESQATSSSDPSELAAWTMICSQILNLDETITR